MQQSDNHQARVSGNVECACAEWEKRTGYIQRTYYGLRPNFLEVLKMLPFIHVLEVKIYLELKHHGSFAVVQLVIYG